MSSARALPALQTLQAGHPAGLSFTSHRRGDAIHKTLIPALALALGTFALPAGAADAASAPAATQQSKMGDCSAQFKATGKPGSERQAFMKECLKKEVDAKTAQNNRMKQCSTDFKKTGKPGSERQAFMKECLSGKS